MSKTVVATVISNLEFGGAQRQLVEFVNHADTERFELHIISLSDYIPLAQEIAAGRAQVHVVQKGWKFDISVVSRLARLLRDIDAMIVHAYLYDAEIASRLAGTMGGVPVIVGSERNTDYTLRRPQVVGYRLTKSLRDACIANSAAGAEFNARLLGYDAGHYIVIPNGVNTDKSRPRPVAAARAALSLHAEKFVVGVVASFKQQKNHALFFRAARTLVDRYPESRLVLVGDELHGGLHGSSEYKESIIRLVTELGLDDYCTFLGNRADVEAIYPAFNVTVLPSLFEGTPNVALESMACGVPVVATDVSDNATVVPDAHCGYIVPLDGADVLAERLVTLASDAELAQRLGNNARDWVEKEYSSSRLARRTEAAYDALLDRSGAFRSQLKRLMPHRAAR